MGEAAYLELARTGELQKRISAARELMSPCTVCPRNCNVDRLAEERGFCKIGTRAMVSSYSPHFGEEEPLVGSHGSGTIFFSSCNLGCVFCQNFEISHLIEGREVEPDELAAMMLQLQGMGCHNINFVTPSHVVPHILEALAPAVEGGLRAPLVYNSGGYDALETLRLLDGVVDIYMPDFKCVDPDVAEKYLTARDYFEVAREAVREMHRQVGDLVVDEAGIAVRGLLVRHLVMPGAVAGTEEAMRFLAEEISPNTYVNIMAQYRPSGDAHKHPEIALPLSNEDYQAALEATRRAGIHRLDSRVGRRLILRRFRGL